jgi:hypothetical protein
MSPVRVLIDRWRSEASELRDRYGLTELARMAETHVSELEQALAEDAVSLMTLDEASAWSGYSTAHLRALVAERKLCNAGRKGAPRFHKGELPIKPGHTPVEPCADPVAEMLMRRQRTIRP